MRKTILTVLLLLLCGGLCWAGSFEDTRRAAQQGDAEAQFNLGMMYGKGQGVPRDNTEAVKWYRRAAQQGDALAQNNLGVMYEVGRGVPRDDTEAVKWYRRAAQQGDALAQTNLGMMYGKGQGVPRDNVSAYAWFSLAAAQGHDTARTYLDRIEQYLTPEQRGEAQRMAREWELKLAAGSGDYEANKSQPGYSETPSQVAVNIRQSLPNSSEPATSYHSGRYDDVSAKGKRLAATSAICSAARMEFHLVGDSSGYELPVRINNAVTLNFMVDSGASEVTIPADVVLTLVRTGTIQQNDFLPGTTVTLADGSELQSMRFVIHELSIDGCRVSDVPAIITPVAGNLLLGQSFLKRFKRWTLDNEHHLLIIEMADRNLTPQKSQQPTSVEEILAEGRAVLKELGIPIPPPSLSPREAYLRELENGP